MDFRTLERIELALVLVFFGTGGYALYDLFQSFSLGSIGLWSGILLAQLMLIGTLLPNWQKIQDLKPLFSQIHARLASTGQKVYRRDLELARRKLFQERNKVLALQKRLQKFPLAKLKQDLAEARNALAAAPADAGHAAGLGRRVRELEQTLARLQAGSRQAEAFEELRKNVKASLQHLLVRLETGEDEDPLGGRREAGVEEDFQHIHAVMDRMERSQRIATPEE